MAVLGPAVSNEAPEVFFHQGKGSFSSKFEKRLVHVYFYTLDVSLQWKLNTSIGSPHSLHGNVARNLDE